MYEKLTGNAAPKGNDELRQSQEIPYRSSFIHYSNSNTVCKLSYLYTVFCRFVEILFLLIKNCRIWQFFKFSYNITDWHLGAFSLTGAAGAKKPPHGTRYGTMAEEEFHSSVSESVSKIVVHSTALIKSMLVDGDMPGLLAILGGLAFARNKIWFYNETIIAARTKVRPFTDRYIFHDTNIENPSSKIDI